MTKCSKFKPEEDPGCLVKLVAWSILTWAGIKMVYVLRVHLIAGRVWFSSCPKKDYWKCTENKDWFEELRLKEPHSERKKKKS